jgi:hypothetical protein
MGYKPFIIDVKHQALPELKLEGLVVFRHSF